MKEWTRINDIPPLQERFIIKGSVSQLGKLTSFPDISSLPLPSYSINFSLEKHRIKEHNISGYLERQHVTDILEEINCLRQRKGFFVFSCRAYWTRVDARMNASKEKRQAILADINRDAETVGIRRRIRIPLFTQNNQIHNRFYCLVLLWERNIFAQNDWGLAFGKRARGCDDCRSLNSSLYLDNIS